MKDKTTRDVYDVEKLHKMIGDLICLKCFHAAIYCILLDIKKKLNYVSRVNREKNKKNKLFTQNPTKTKKNSTVLKHIFLLR